MSAYDMALGSKVLIGDLNWRKGPVLAVTAAFFFGRRERFEHLGMHVTLAWWKGSPYLIGLREVRS